MEVGEDDSPLEFDDFDGIQEKHALTVREMLVVKEKEREKQVKDRRVPLTGFNIVRTGTFTWAGSDCRGGFIPPKRHTSLCDIFEKLCPVEVIQEMIGEAERTKIKGAHRISVTEVRKFRAVRIWITGKRPKPLWEKWKLPADVFGEKPMGRDSYKRLQGLWLCPSAVVLLNEASQSVIEVPEVLTIDEKLKGFTGETPYLRYVPNKDPTNGHWITECTMKAPKSGLPFLVNAIPVQQAEGPTMLEFYQNSLGWMDDEQKKKVVIVSDAYYMDDASRRWLRANHFKYLVSVNPQRFREVWKPLAMKVKKKKQIAVAWCSTTGEAAALLWTTENKKSYMLTNAFTYSSSGTPVNATVFSDTYCHLFNTADRLNSYLYHRGYPWRRTGWIYNFDNFHFTSLLWNVYVMHHELNQLEQEMDWCEFCVLLAKQLWGKFA
jgi:hypothetical protein